MREEYAEVSKDAQGVTVVKGTPVLPMRAWRTWHAEEAAALVHFGATLKAILRYPNDVTVWEFDRADALAHKGATLKEIVNADDAAQCGPLAELVRWAREE